MSEEKTPRTEKQLLKLKHDLKTRTRWYEIMTQENQLVLKLSTRFISG